MPGEVSKLITELPSALSEATMDGVDQLEPRHAVDSLPRMPYLYVVSHERGARYVERRVVYPLLPGVIEFYECNY